MRAPSCKSRFARKAWSPFSSAPNRCMPRWKMKSAATRTGLARQDCGGVSERSETLKIHSVQQHFDGGAFAATLSRRVAWRTESDTGTVPPMRNTLPTKCCPSYKAWALTAKCWRTPTPRVAPAAGTGWKTLPCLPC